MKNKWVGMVLGPETYAMMENGEIWKATSGYDKFVPISAPVKYKPVPPRPYPLQWRKPEDRLPEEMINSNK
jgi:hypothetical protein